MQDVAVGVSASCLRAESPPYLEAGRGCGTGQVPEPWLLSTHRNWEGWIMKGGKCSVWKILGAGAALLLMLPQLALGEFGVCPPYSKTFGPEDAPTEINAFIVELNLRPGGGTLFLEPGEYGFPDPVDDMVPITGVVCIQPLDAGSAILIDINSDGPYVEAGGILTLRSVNVGAPDVAADGTLFAENVSAGGINNDGVAYLHGVTNPEVVENGGTLVWRGGTAAEFRNSGWALFDQVRLSGYAHCPNVTCYEFAPAVVNSGVVTLQRSVITEDCGPEPQHGCSDAITNSSGASVYAAGSTIVGPIINGGGTIEIDQSVVDGGCGTDTGYNVFSNTGCAITESTSVQADPLLGDGYELGAGSPAIDLIPLELCKPTDGLGRARTDGDGDGVVACDAGALEYGYGFIEATVRARPYHWREVGTIDLSVTDLMTIYVFSTETFDATQIVFSTVEIEGFEDDAKGWPWTIDVGKDGLVDYQVTWWLTRQPPLPCGYQEHEFTAMTEDGTLVRGLLKFEAVGCTP
jgi:hypothetical protein